MKTVANTMANCTACSLLGIVVGIAGFSGLFHAVAPWYDYFMLSWATVFMAEMIRTFIVPEADRESGLTLFQHD